MTTSRRTPIAVPARGGVLTRIGSAAFTVASIFGSLCIVLVILGLTMHISLIMFGTGSMAPAIPAGSVAVVQRIAAAEMEVGDVVTVDRPGRLPVTHRVVEIIEVDGDAATFVLRGDANEHPDPEPYTAEHVRVVLWSMPGLARFVVPFQNPFVLGLMTLGATAVVVWSFWPRRGPDPARSPEDGQAPDAE